MVTDEDEFAFCDHFLFFLTFLVFNFCFAVSLQLRKQTLRVRRKNERKKHHIRNGNTKKR